MAAAVTLAACGDDDDSDKAPAAASTVAATAPAASTTAAEPAADGASVIADLTTKGTEKEPPTEGPAPAKGKTVWWVSCGPIAPDCAVPMEAAKEAAKKLGITLKTADGKLNQAGGYLNAMRTALALKPDAIIAHALDCVSVTPALKEAKEKGIPVLGVEMADCDVPPVNKEPLLTQDMIYTDGVEDTEAYFNGWGKAAAQYLIAKSGGNAKIIVNEGTDSVFPPMNQGFMDEIKTCSGCEIVDTVTFTAAEQIPNGPWIQRFRTSLTKHPEATATFIPSDYGMTGLGGGKAVKDAKREMIIVGGSGSAPGMDAVRSGLITADTYAHDANWMGYAAMDTINRMLQGQPAVSEGIGTRAVDADNNVPEKPGSAYASPIDWRTAYDKLWGVTQ